MTPEEIAKLPQTYYMGNGQWGHKCPCGARETGEPHEWHAMDCHRYHWPIYNTREALEANPS